MTPPVLRPLSTGEVLDVSFGLYRALFIPLLTVALITRAVPVIMGIYLQASGGITQHLMLSLVQMVVAMVLTSVGVAATTYVVSGAYLGTDISANEALQRAASMVGRLIVLSLMTGLITGFGFILLIIPGVVLFAGLALSTAVLVLEAPISANDAMSRSWALTKGDKGKVLVTIIVAILLLVVPSIIVGAMGGIGSVFGLWTRFIPLVLVGVLDLFVYPFLYVVITVLYYDMRVRKEGFDLELLASATQRG